MPVFQYTYLRSSKPEIKPVDLTGELFDTIYNDDIVVTEKPTLFKLDMVVDVPHGFAIQAVPSPAYAHSIIVDNPIIAYPGEKTELKVVLTSFSGTVTIKAGQAAIRLLPIQLPMSTFVYV